MNQSVAHPLDNATLEDLRSPLTTVALPVMYLLVMAVSTPCNLLSLLLLCIFTKRKTSTIIFALNLSLADLLYSTSLPLQASYHFSGNSWRFGVAACGVTTVTFHSSMQCSLLLTCAIAVERYLGVVRPLRAKQWCSPRRAALACLLLWGVALAVQSPLMRQDLTRRVEELGLTTCFDVIPRGTFGTRTLTYVYFGAIFLFLYSVPLLVLLFCYVSVALELRRRPEAGGPDRSRRYALIMCGAAALCFLLCYLPNMLLQVLHMCFRSRGRSLYRYYKLTHGINSLSCCVDPFVYYLASQDFRHTFRKALRSLRSCGQREREELSTPSEVVSFNKAPPLALAAPRPEHQPC